MEQMKIDPEMRVAVDLDQFTPNVQLLKPEVFKDGDSYCCVLGPDPAAGILGRGPTPEAAIRDWDNNLEEFIADPDENDPVAEYVLSTLNSGV